MDVPVAAPKNHMLRKVVHGLGMLCDMVDKCPWV